MAEGKRATEVMMKQERRGANTTMTYRTKRYTFPSAPTQGDVKSDAMCVMLDMGLHCPHCTSAFSAKFSATHKRVSGKRPHDHHGHNRPAIGGPEAQQQALVRKDPATHAQPHLDGTWYHEVEANVAVSKTPRHGEQLTIRDMKVYMRDPKKKIPPPVPPRKGKSAPISREDAPRVANKPPPPPPKSPAISMTQSEPGGHQVRRWKKTPPPVPPRKRPPPRDNDTYIHTDGAILYDQQGGDRVKMHKSGYGVTQDYHPEFVQQLEHKRATAIPVYQTDDGSHPDQPTQDAFAKYCITGKPNDTRPSILTKKRPLTKYDLNLSPRPTHKRNNMTGEKSVSLSPAGCRPQFPLRTKSVSPNRFADTNNQPPHVTFTPPTRKRPLTKYDFNLQDIPPYRKRTYSKSSDRSDKSSNNSQKPPPPPVPKRLYPPGSSDGKIPSRKSTQALKASSFPYRLRDVNKHRVRSIPVYSEVVYTTKSPGERLTANGDQGSPPPKDEELERLITEGLSSQQISEPVSSSADRVPISPTDPTAPHQGRFNHAKEYDPTKHREMSYAVVGVPGRVGAQQEFETHSLPRMHIQQSSPHTQAVGISSNGNTGRVSSIRVTEKKTQKRVFQDMAKHESMETLCHQRDQTINVTSIGNVHKETVVASTEQISISRQGYNEPEEEKPDVGIDELVDELHNLEDRLTDISNEPKQPKPVNFIRRTIIKHNITPENMPHDITAETNHSTSEQNKPLVNDQRTPVIEVGDYMVGGARTKVHKVILRQQPAADEHQHFEDNIMSNIEQYDSADDKLSNDEQGSRDTLDTLDLLVSEAQACYPSVSRDRTPVPLGEQVGDVKDGQKEKDTSGSSDEDLSVLQPDFEGNVDDILENADTTRYSPNATLKNVFTQPRKKKRRKKMLSLIESDKENSPEKVFEEIMDAAEEGHNGVEEFVSDPDLKKYYCEQQRSQSTSVECIPDDRSYSEFGRITPSAETKSEKSLGVITNASSDMIPSSNYGGASESSLDRMIDDTSALTEQILTSYSVDIKRNEDRLQSASRVHQTSSDNEIIELDDDSEISSSHDMLEHSDASDYDSADLILDNTVGEHIDTNRFPSDKNKHITILRKSPEIRSAPQTLDRRMRVRSEFDADSTSDSLENSFVFQSKQEARTRGSWPNADVLQRMLSPLERGQVYDVRRTVTPDNLSYKTSFFSASSEVEISTRTNPHTPEPVPVDHKQLMNRELSLEFGKIKEDFDNRPRVASVNKGDIRTCEDIRVSPPREDYTVESAIHELRRSPIMEQGNDMDRSTEIYPGEILTLSREYTLCTDQLCDVNEIAALKKTRDEIVDRDTPTDQYNSDFERRPSVLHATVTNYPSEDYATVKRGPGSLPTSEDSSLSPVYHHEVTLDQYIPTPSDATDTELSELCNDMDADEEPTPQYVNIEAALQNSFQPQHAQVVQLRDHVHEGSPVLMGSVIKEDEPDFDVENSSDDEDEPYIKQSVSTLIDQFNKDFERKPSVVTAKVPLDIRTSYSPKMQRKELLKPVNISFEDDVDHISEDSFLVRDVSREQPPKVVTLDEVKLTRTPTSMVCEVDDEIRPLALQRTESNESREQMDSVYERKSSHTGAPIHESIKASYSPRVPKKSILRVVKIPSVDSDDGDDDVSDNISAGDLDDEIEDIINELRRDAEEQELLYSQTSDTPIKKSNANATFKIDRNRNHPPHVICSEVKLDDIMEPHYSDEMNSTDKKVSESAYDVIVSGVEPTPNLCVRTTQADPKQDPSLQDSCKYLLGERPEPGLHETSQLAEDSFNQAGVIFVSAASPGTAGRPQQPGIELGHPGQRQPAPQPPASPCSQQYQTDTLLASLDSTEQELTAPTDDMSSVAQTSICTETQMDFAKAKVVENDEAPKERRPSVAEGSICMETQFEVAEQHKTKIESENEKNREKSGAGERRASVATESVCDETQFDLADSKKAEKDAVNAERRASVATETVCAETQFDLANHKPGEEKGQTETGGHNAERRSSAATASICMETQLDFAKLDLSKEKKVSNEMLYEADQSLPDGQQIKGEHVGLPIAMLGSCDSVGDVDYKEQVDLHVERRPSAVSVSVCSEAVLNIPQIDKVDLRHIPIEISSKPNDDKPNYLQAYVCDDAKLEEVNVSPNVLCNVDENSIDGCDEIISDHKSNADDHSQSVANVKVCPDSNLTKATAGNQTKFELSLHPPLHERKQDTPESEADSICSPEPSFSPVTAHSTEEENVTPALNNKRDIKISDRPQLKKMNSTIDIDNSVCPFDQITPSTSDESEKEGTPSKGDDVKDTTDSQEQPQPSVVIREQEDDHEVDISSMCVFDLLSQVHTHYDRRTSAASAAPCLDSSEPSSDTENDKATVPTEKSPRRSSVTTPIFPVENPFDQESVSEAPTNRRPSVATETVCIETQLDVADCDDDSSSEVAITEDVPSDIIDSGTIVRRTSVAKERTCIEAQLDVVTVNTTPCTERFPSFISIEDRPDDAVNKSHTVGISSTDNEVIPDGEGIKRAQIDSYADAELSDRRISVIHSMRRTSIAEVEICSETQLDIASCNAYDDAPLSDRRPSVLPRPDDSQFRESKVPKRRASVAEETEQLDVVYDIIKPPIDAERAHQPKRKSSLVATETVCMEGISEIDPRGEVSAGEYVPVRRSSIATTSVVLETIVDKSEQIQSQCEVLYQDAELSERRPSVLPTAQDIEKSFSSFPAEVAIEQELKQIPQEVDYDDAELSGRRPSILPTNERRSSIATGEICMETSLEFVSSNQIVESECHQDGIRRDSRHPTEPKEVCTETQLDSAAADKSDTRGETTAPGSPSTVPVGRRASLAAETTCLGTSFERVKISETKPIQSNAVDSEEPQKGVLDIDFSVVPYDDMLELSRDQWNRVSVRKPSATNSSIDVESLKQFARVESSQVRVCHEVLDESVHRIPSRDNLDDACGNIDISIVDHDIATQNVLSNQTVQNVRPLHLGTTTCSLHDLSDNGNIITNIAHESNVSDRTCDSAIRRPSLASESILEPIHSGIKVVDFKPKKSIKTDKANIYAYAYTCAHDIFSAAMHDICRKYVQSKRKHSLQHGGPTDQTPGDNTLHLYTESHANVASYETDESLTKQEAEGFLHHMLVSHRSETSIAAGKSLLASEDLAECLAAVCRVPDDPEEEVLSEELTTHEVIIEFKWPRSAWTPPLKLYKEPYREISVKRVTRISDFDVDRKELESSDTRPRKTKELTDSDSNHRDSAERTMRSETVEEKGIRQAKPTHVAGHVYCGGIDDSAGVSDVRDSGETALSTEPSHKSSAASGSMTVGGGFLGDRGFRYMQYSGSGTLGDGTCFKSDAQPTHVPRLLYPETHATPICTRDNKVQHATKTYALTHGGSAGSIQEHGTTFGQTGVLQKNDSTTYNFELEQRDGIYYVTQKSSSAPDIREPSEKYIKFPRQRHRRQKVKPRSKNAKIVSDSGLNRSLPQEEPTIKRFKSDEPVTVYDLTDQMTTSGSAVSDDDDREAIKLDYDELEETLRKNCPFYPAQLSDSCCESASTAVTPVPDSLPDLCIDAERQSLSLSDKTRSSSSTLDRTSKTVEEIFGQMSQNELSESESESSGGEDFSFGQVLESDAITNQANWVINPIAVTDSLEQNVTVPFDYATYTKSTTESVVSDSRSSCDTSQSESEYTMAKKDSRKASITRQHAVDLAYADDALGIPEDSDTYTPSREDSDTASDRLSLEGLKVMYPRTSVLSRDFRPAADDSESTLSAESDSEEHTMESYHQQAVISRSMPSVYTSFGRCGGQIDSPEQYHELDYFLFAQEGVRVIRPAHPDDLEYLDSDKSDHFHQAPPSRPPDAAGSEQAMFDRLQVMTERFQEDQEEIAHEHRRLELVTLKQRSEEHPVVSGKAEDEGRSRSLSWGADPTAQPHDKCPKSQVRQRIRSRREFAIRARLHNPRSTSTSSSDRSPLPFRKWTPRSSGSSQDRLAKHSERVDHHTHRAHPWQADLLERSFSSPVLSPTSHRKQADSPATTSQTDVLYPYIVHSSRFSPRKPPRDPTSITDPFPNDDPFTQFDPHGSRQVEVNESLIGPLPGQPIVTTRTPPRPQRRAGSHQPPSGINPDENIEPEQVPKPGNRERLVKKLSRKPKYR